MNTHRIALQVGSRHFQPNPVGLLHRVISERSSIAWRHHCADDVFDRESKCGLHRAFATWRVASGAASAAQALRKVDGAIDATFGTCLAHRISARPSWESEGMLTRLGNIPLHGLILLGAQIGTACAAMRNGDRGCAAATGARWGAIVGGAMAYVWSQGLALVGFAAKLALRVPTAALLGFVQVFEPMDVQLRRDALLSR